MSAVPYDDIAEIYDAWCESVPVAAAMQAFYVDLLAASEEPVAELGVGNGRICVEAARRGRRVVGVDYSRNMLDLCRSRSAAAGVAERVTLVEADFRDFALPEPARLVVIPFHTIGHLVTEADQRRALENIHGQLAPGGRLAFDHFIFDPDYPVPPGLLHLRSDLRDAESGRSRLVWETTTRDPERQLLHVLVQVQDLDPAGTVESSRYTRIDMRWLHPDQTRDLLEEAGFEIEALYGGFDRAPFDESSPYQIWFARRPRS